MSEVFTTAISNHLAMLDSNAKSRKTAVLLQESLVYIERQRTEIANLMRQLDELYTERNEAKRRIAAGLTPYLHY